ncbi:Aste57867_21528 [Aphanomyces stellatus]|uniref:Aste57867_21528 protein n=1 Tax=Aphanomyces stellatus TaxID=120398 RepID=A0A485LHS3_9STRA|nr:hypothetical protein As57867_021459 [Aphanomyces stellatus]VFT98198.1 Aste57867_21528 [Aphanomyces stellatus]
MDQILHAILLSDKSDDEKKLCVDHILASSLTPEQSKSVSAMCWAMWPEGTSPPNVELLTYTLKQLPMQFIVCSRRYLNSSAASEPDCFRWMQEETRQVEWIPVIKVLFFFLAMRPTEKLARVYAVLQHCPTVPFSTFLVVKDLYLDASKLAAVLIKLGRLPMRGHTGHWLKQFLLLLVKDEQWVVLVKGGTDVLLSVAEQLSGHDTVLGSLVVLETIFLGYQENADVFVAFFAHFHDRLAPWFEADATALPTPTLVYLHEMLQGLLFAFPGHPLLQTKLVELCRRLPPLPDTFDVDAYVEALRWKNCKQGDQSPFGASTTEDSGSGSSGSGGEDSVIQPALYEGYIGLRNVGNTCYMNSVLQGLFMTPAMRHLVLTSSPTASSTKRSLDNGPITAEFRALLRYMHDSHAACVDSGRLQRSVTMTSPNSSGYDVIRRFRATLAAEFQTSRQQDASEFLHYVLDKLSSPGGVSGVPKSTFQDMVGRLFTGKYARRITCSRCEAVSTTVEEFMDMNVPVPTSSPASLEALVQSQLATELLADANAYFCDACHDRVEAIKQTVVDHAPEHLILTMSRFQYNATRGVREKICTPVRCSTTLLLPVDAISAGIHYILYAAIVHAGSRADHGHYYTFARTLPEASQVHETTTTPRWHLLNDSRVSPVDDALVLHTLTQSTSDTPYVLFFRRCLAANGGGDDATTRGDR